MLLWRRTLALFIPIVILVAAAIAARSMPMGSVVRAAIEFPAAGVHGAMMALGVRSWPLAVGIAAGGVFALLSLVCSAVLHGRERIGVATLRVMMTAALVGAVAWRVSL